MVLFRRACRLNSYLVRAKLYHFERMVDSEWCKSKQYQVCIKFMEANSFTCGNDQTLK